MPLILNDITNFLLALKRKYILSYHHRKKEIESERNSATRRRKWREKEETSI